MITTTEYVVQTRLVKDLVVCLDLDHQVRQIKDLQTELTKPIQANLQEC